MSKVTDLTLPIITGHWRYPNQSVTFKSFAKGDPTNVTEYTLRTHQFTHVDAPFHFYPDGKKLDEFPISILLGEAAVLDISDLVSSNTPINAKMLENAYKKCHKARILLIKTAWDSKTSWLLKDYWDKAPYMTAEAAEYIVSLAPDVVGFDFPQDRDIRFLSQKDIRQCDMTTHRIILGRDILMIEYLCNLDGVTAGNVSFAGLPLNLKNADGAQIRCICVAE